MTQLAGRIMRTNKADENGWQLVPVHLKQTTDADESCLGMSEWEGHKYFTNG